MSLTHTQSQAADALRATGLGDRKIAEALDVSVWSVRKDRERRASLIPGPEDGPKILLYDIETAPALVWVWNQWKTNVIATEQDWYSLSFAYRWLGSEETGFVSIFQDPDFEPDTDNDLYVVEALRDLFDEADMTVAHNGNSFDVKKMNARFLTHRLEVPSPYQTLDTKLEYNRYFKDYSASLNEIARRHGLGAKVQHTGFDLWRKCMAGDPDAWALMEEYNRHDVVLLDGLYKLLLPWMGSPGKPGGPVNYGFWSPGETVCKRCGSADLAKNGSHRTNVSEFQCFKCRSCGGYGRARKRNSQKETGGPQIV